MLLKANGVLTTKMMLVIAHDIACGNTRKPTGHRLGQLRLRPLVRGRLPTPDGRHPRTALPTTTRVALRWEG
jgi:hypothetical protein